MWVPFAGRFWGRFGGYRDDGSHMDGCSGVVLKNALKRKKMWVSFAGRFWGEKLQWGGCEGDISKISVRTAIPYTTQ